MSAPTTVAGVCPHDCPDACGIVSTVQDGRIRRILADPGHGPGQGWLCAKVAPYLERVYHPDRLTHPLRRTGARGGGGWSRITWDEALAEIAGRWREIMAQHGAEAILPFSYSGTLGLLQMTVASSRLWNRLGASRLERSICMAATRFAVRCTLGARRSPPYHHLLDSGLIVLWAHNPHSTAPHMMPYLRRARRRGAVVVVIDPYRSRSARGADRHLAPLPGTDGALALGLANELVRQGHADTRWLERHTVGWEAYLDRLERYPADRVAGWTGVPAEEIAGLAALMGSRPPLTIRMGDALNRNLQGGQTVRAVAALPALTGHYGVRGGGLGCSTGDYFAWDDEAVNHWQDCPAPGRSINMNRLGAALTGEAVDPPIRSLFVFGANPMVSCPNTRLIESGLKRPDLFTVVHDLFLTDTAQLADIVLPATSQLEHVDLHRGYGHTTVAYNHPAIAPLGEARSNWRVMQDLGAALGFDEPWLRAGDDEVIEEILEATRPRWAALDAIRLRDLKAAPGLPYADPDEVPFHGPAFPTPSGKLELYSDAFAAQGGDPLPAWRPPMPDAAPDHELAAHGLDLVSPATHHFVNSSLANLPTLRRRERRPQVLLNARDAADRGLREGDLVEVFNQRGACRLRLSVSEDVRPGVAVSFKGFWRATPEAGTINATTSDRLADVEGQSTFHSTRVWVRPARGAGR